MEFLGDKQTYLKSSNWPSETAMFIKSNTTAGDKQDRIWLSLKGQSTNFTHK